MINSAQSDSNSTIQLVSGEASASIALMGAEPMSWRIRGRELLWHGDPAHWSFRAPILFPVVGASSGGVVRVGNSTYPMPQHGFARRSPFSLVAQGPESATLRLVDTEATRAHFPFGFQLDVTATLSPDTLSLAFAVTNTDAATLPFAIGFHPAFTWPFDGGERSDYRVLLSDEEKSRLAGVTDAALLVPDGRASPLEGRTLNLDPQSFTEALVVLDANSRSMAFEAPSGAAIDMTVEGLPHLAIWTKPAAPFLSLEAWSGHADWDGFAGDLSERASMQLLAPGATASQTILLTWRDAASRV